MAPAGLLEGKNKDNAKEILTAALKTDFNDEEQAGAFESKYKSKWEKKSASNILCVLARKDEWEKDRSFKWTDEKTGEFLAWILKSYHTLLEVKEKTYQMSPLHLALMQDHTAFIEAVLSFPKLMNINQVLIEKGQQGNALHIAVDKTSSSLERLVQKCAQSVTMFTCKHPGTGNTPLHACMSVDLDAEINDGDSESEDGDEDGSSVASQDQSSGPSDDEDEINKSTLRLMVRGSLNQRGGQSTKILEGLSPTDKVLSAVKKLIDSHHRVLFSYNLQNRTPYQERLYQLQKANATEKGSQQTSKPGSGQDETAVDLSGLQKAIAEDQIASYIRSYCVKNFARDDVMKCLYTTGKEKHIEFDLGGLGRDTITRDYLNQLSKHLQFESILNIEEALNGFEVEIWDWKRLDLSTEVIRKSTKVVREISLYSTGNNAVLMGWASLEGLPNKEHFPEVVPHGTSAIRWATDCDVDIISMSWTIETPVPGNAEMKSLEDAVKAAESKNIVMLCSTSDQGSLTKDYCYPGDFGGCIKIGSATNTGDAMAWVNVEKVDFLTPGSNVPFSNNEGKIVWHESGSSVATAAASGLAGLLMFSSWLLNKADNHLNNSNNMKVAFKNLAADTKYPRVYERLEQRFKDVLARAEDNESRRTEDLPLTWNIFCKEALEDVIRRVNDLS
ncbi:hypothetical protein K4K60_004436 [Colletotrichum sp. SAR11_57]|nr:hypothetical protein K4K60_004436 [Colletotrichum sp. SAR11_57]